MTYSAPVTARAEQHALHSLLNCYLREHGCVHHQITFSEQPDQQQWPLQLHRSWRQHGGYLLQINLPQQARSLSLLVDSNDFSANLRYLTPCYGGEPLQELPFATTTRQLVQELCLHFDQPLNDELLSQIDNSRDFIKRLLQQAPDCQTAPTPAVDAYISSEQQMSLGHAFHPAPKARVGFDAQQLQQYSPEFGAPFQLHYFAVAQALFQHADNGTISGAQIINQDLPEALNIPAGFQPIPCHPWQAGYIRSLAAVQQLLTDGQLIDLGPQGQSFYATSSVRTLYSPASQHFYKGSLHIRLTNCLRKNAIYELETALYLSQLLEQQQLSQVFPDLQLLLEPGWATVNPQLDDPEQTVLVQEAFAMIFRSNFTADELSSYTPVVAGSLFSENPFGPNRARTLIGQYARRHDIAFNSAALQWFQQYAEGLCLPVLYAYFERGLIFEPHLQNVLLGMQDDAPQKVILRDMEGTKLVSEAWPLDAASPLSEQGQKAMRYNQAKGWQRVAYCLFINNLFQAVFYIAGGDPILKHQLRAVLGEVLHSYLQQYPSSHAQQVLSDVLAGNTLPNKTNLLIRVQKQADKEAGYVPLANPIIAPLNVIAEASNA